MLGRMVGLKRLFEARQGSALYGILVAITGADGEVDQSELTRLEAIVRRLGSQLGISEAELMQDLPMHLDTLRATGAEQMVAEYAAQIPEGLRYACFALCAELTMADGELHPAERRVLHSLATTLEIPRELVENVMDVVSRGGQLVAMEGVWLKFDFRQGEDVGEVLARTAEFTRHGRYREAIGPLEQLLTTLPMEGKETCRVWVELGVCHSAIGRKARALECFEKASLANPTSGRAWASRAELLAELKRVDEAVEAIEKAIELEPDEPAWKAQRDAIT